MTTIPASAFVKVTPSVVGAGGDELQLNGLVLTTSARVPIGTVQSFASAAAVRSFFGASSAEAIIAGGATGLGAGYFGGYANSTRKPAALLFAQYPSAAVAAYLRGGNISADALATLQAISGSLDVTIDGVAYAATVNLSSATSFSSAAGLIQSALTAAAPADASVTGSIGGTATAAIGASFTGSGSGTTLTATSVTGKIHDGDVVSGSGVPVGTTIVNQISGTPGGAGDYLTSAATTASTAAITATSSVMDVTGSVTGSLQAGDALSGSGVTAGTTIVDQLSGTPGAVGTYLVSAAQHVASETITALSTVLDVTAVGSGSLEVGSPIAGTGVPANSKVTAILAGSGGVGTYRVNNAATTISETITSTVVPPTVAYDTVSGAFQILSGTTGAASSIGFASGSTAAALLLTAATGAATSQGAADAVPGTFMDGVIEVTTNWATFMTGFDPDGGSGNTEKLAFAQWVDGTDDRYAYVCWDTDVAPTQGAPATGSLGYLVDQAGYSGVCLDYEPSDLNHAAFVCGAVASIDFAKAGGRVTLAYKSQSGLVASVSTLSAAVNLGGDPQIVGDRGNGYNYYGAVATANQSFMLFQRGFVSGPFQWLDSYVNQIWLNNRLQFALVNLLANVNSVPFGAAGYSMISQALAQPIQDGLTFGAFGPGSISALQAAEVNAAAGANIATTLQTQGWFLQVLDPASDVRASRGPLTPKFWYLDRGSVQSVNLASVAVQ